MSKEAIELTRVLYKVKKTIETKCDSLFNCGWNAGGHYSEGRDSRSQTAEKHGDEEKKLILEHVERIISLTLEIYRESEEIILQKGKK